VHFTKMPVPNPSPGRIGHSNLKSSRTCSCFRSGRIKKQTAHGAGSGHLGSNFTMSLFHSFGSEGCILAAQEAAGALARQADGGGVSHRRPPTTRTKTRHRARDQRPRGRRRTRLLAARGLRILLSREERLRRRENAARARS